MTPKGSVHEAVTSVVRLLLEQRGPSKGELAGILGIPASSVSHVLGSGERTRAWRIEEIVILADHYGVSTDALLRVGSPERERLLGELAAEYVDQAR